LEIDKILIRYFSSQTATAQKLPCLHFGTHFALPIFFVFRDCAKAKRTALRPHIKRKQFGMIRPSAGFKQL